MWEAFIEIYGLSFPMLLHVFISKGNELLNNFYEQRMEEALTCKLAERNHVCCYRQNVSFFDDYCRNKYGD